MEISIVCFVLAFFSGVGRCEGCWHGFWLVARVWLRPVAGVFLDGIVPSLFPKVAKFFLVCFVRHLSVVGSLAFARPRSRKTSFVHPSAVAFACLFAFFCGFRLDLQRRGVCGVLTGAVFAICVAYSCR